MRLKKSNLLLEKNMIQRIQSIYLFAVSLASFALAIGVMRKWGGLEFSSRTELFVFAEALFMGFLALGSLLKYKNRQQQFVLNRINLLLQLFLLGFFVYRSLNLSGGGSPEKGIGMLIPVFSIVMLVLANRAIKHDEDLVKSADRLR